MGIVIRPCGRHEVGLSDAIWNYPTPPDSRFSSIVGSTRGQASSGELPIRKGRPVGVVGSRKVQGWLPGITQET